jgi:hypothetical protein
VEAISVGCAKVYMLKGVLLHVRSTHLQQAIHVAPDHAGASRWPKAPLFERFSQQRYLLPRG